MLHQRTLLWGFWSKHFASKGYVHQLSCLVTWNRGNLVNFVQADSAQIPPMSAFQHPWTAFQLQGALNQPQPRGSVS